MSICTLEIINLLKIPSILDNLPDAHFHNMTYLYNLPISNLRANTTCELLAQPANFLVKILTFFSTCQLFWQTCQLFPNLPTFMANLPTFMANLPTFSETCQLLSQDLGGDPPPPQIANYRNPGFYHKLVTFALITGSNTWGTPLYPHFMEGGGDATLPAL